MFGFLKNKLKEAISKFSKKAEEEAKVGETVKEESKIEEKKKSEVKQIEIVQESKGFLGLFKKKKVTEEEEVKETTEIKINHKHPEKEETFEEKVEVKRPVEEKKGFFSKLAEKITTKRISEVRYGSFGIF